METYYQLNTLIFYNNPLYRIIKLKKEQTSITKKQLYLRSYNSTITTAINIPTINNITTSSPPPPKFQSISNLNNSKRFKSKYHKLYSNNPIKQGIDSIKQEQKLESNKINSEIRIKVEQAIESFRYRVTVGDVAGRAGISLYDAENALKAIAADSQGNLEVSNEGEIVYVFQKDFKSIIRSKSILLRWEPGLKLTKKILDSIVRTSFGVIFVLTVVSVWATILLILTASDKDNDRKRSSNNNMGLSRAFMAFDAIDLFRIWYYFRSPDPVIKKGKKQELSFFESVFSFVFGDGDPNKDFEEKRWNIIGKYIQSKGGVVIAEQLKPYLDIKESKDLDKDSIIVDESFMLPVLTRFGGDPIVTKDGKLIYIFPKLQQTGSKMRSMTPYEKYLMEEKWKLTLASKTNIFFVVLLGIFNLIGVGILNGLLTESVINGVISPLYLPLLAPLMFVLGLYSSAFFLVPAIRAFVNYNRNKSINKRNSLRFKNAQIVQKPSFELSEKMQIASSYAKRNLLKKEDMIFSSGKEMGTQAAKLEQEEFDKRLKMREKNNQ